MATRAEGLAMKRKLAERYGKGNYNTGPAGGADIAFDVGDSELPLVWE